MGNAGAVLASRAVHVTALHTNNPGWTIVVWVVAGLAVLATIIGMIVWR